MSDNNTQTINNGEDIKQLTPEQIKKKSTKNRINKIVKYVFLVLVLVFMVKFFQRNLNDIKGSDIRINWVSFIASLLIFFVYKLTQASLWHYITKLNNSAIKHTRAVTVYLYSTLGKYIPGKVFTLAARFPAYDEAGVPMRKVTICFLLENLCTLLGAAFLFLISLFFFPNDILSKYRYLLILLVIIFFICINPKIINFFLRILEKITHKKDMVITITYPQMISVVVLFILNWLVSGVGFYMLVNSITPVDISQMLYVAGIFGLSVTVGFFAVFAPSGIGVREFIMVLGFTTMTHLMSDGMAGVVAVISRLWISIGELLLVIVAFIINRIVESKRKKEAIEQVKE